MRDSDRPMLPLSGIRVIDFTHIVAGPMCTSLMGDMGADVIKVERPGKGDDARGYDQAYPGADSAAFIGINRSKRSVTLNLQQPEGAALARRLVAGADVIIESYRPGTMDRLGLGYEDLKPNHPALIYCSISAFGRSGPLASKPGMDLVVQAMAGMMALTGEPGRPPAKAGTPAADVFAAYLACTGVLLALRVRDAGGGGQRVDIALYDGVIASAANYLTGFFATGKPEGPSGSGHPLLVPYQAFKAADRYLTVACFTEPMWQRLCGALGRADLLTDPRFHTNRDRAAHREELVPLLEALFSQRTAGEWAALLEAADVPCGPVNGLGEAFAHPQTRANQMVCELEHPVAGAIPVPGIDRKSVV